MHWNLSTADMIYSGQLFIAAIFIDNDTDDDNDSYANISDICFCENSQSSL